MWRLVLFITVGVSFASARSATAGLVVSFQSPVALTAGSAVPADIAVSISGEPINEISLVFRITRDAGNVLSPTYLPEFVTAGSPATDPTLNDPHYIFGSYSAFGGFDVFGTASDPDGTGYKNTFTGGDFSLIGDISIGPDNNLLARLQVSAAGILNPTNAGPGGDRFMIELDLASSRFYNDDGQVMDVTADTGAIIVTGAGPVTVPEPSTLPMALCGIGVWGVYQAARAGRRKSAVRGLASLRGNRSMSTTGCATPTGL
jgi:hypothetical protein